MNKKARGLIYQVFVALFFLCLIASTAPANVTINETNFPDPVFRQYVLDNFAPNSNELEDQYIPLIDRIIVPEMNISSLKGIEYFTAIQGLDCSSNDLSELNLASNTELTIIFCHNNKLEKLDVSNNKKLVSLYCDSNALSEIDLSQNSELVTLSCGWNKLTKLNVTRNQKLENLYCFFNNLTELDISNNSALKNFACGVNEIETIDATHKPDLQQFDISNNLIYELDISDSPNLQALNIDGNFFTKLDLSANTELLLLSAVQNLIKALDLSANTKLTGLAINDNKITNLDLSANTNLEQLISGTILYNLAVDPSGNTAYPYAVDMKNYVGQDNISKIIDVKGYNTNDETVTSNFDKESGIAYFASDVRYIVYDYDVGYTGPADIKSINVTVSFNTNTMIVPEYGRTADYNPNVDLTSSTLASIIAAQLGTVSSDVYSFSDAMTGNSWTLNNSRRSMLTNSGAKILFALPEIQSPINAAFVVRCFFNDNVNAGDKIDLYNLANSGAEKFDSVMFDNAGNVVQAVPADKETYLAVKLASGQTLRGAVTSTAGSGNTETPSGNLGGSGGGCDTGLGSLAILILSTAFMKSKKRIAAKKFLLTSLILMLLVLPSHAEEVTTADYIDPIDFEVYKLSGGCDTKFTITDSMKDFVVNNWPTAFGTLTRDNVISFEDAVSTGWTTITSDFLNFSNWGVRAVTTLPVVASGSSENVYIVRCTFGDDVQEGERIDAFGYNVDTTTLKHDRYDQSLVGSVSNTMFFVEENNSFTRVTTVPANKTIYVAISLFRPEYINTGVLTVVRGVYHVEDDPVDRLPQNFTQMISQQLGIDIDEIKYLSALQLGKPAQPTEDIIDYIGNDNHEIIINLPTTLASSTAESEQAWYAISVDINDSMWADIWGEKWSELEGQNVSDYKVYAFGEDEIADERFQVAVWQGVVNTFELFSFSGEKLKQFGVREFLMIGFLDTSKPFSFYLGKLLLSLLLGGCKTGVDSSFSSIVILCLIILKTFKARKL